MVCKIVHAPGRLRVELGWHTFPTAMSHLAVCAGSESHPGRKIMAVCGATSSRSRAVDPEGHGYLVARKTCKTCRRRIEERNRQAVSV